MKYSKEGEEKMTDVIEEYAARKAEAAAKAVEEYAARKAEALAKEAEKKEQRNRIELAKGLLADGMSIEFTARHSKLSEAEVRELASKLTA